MVMVLLKTDLEKALHIEVDNGLSTMSTADVSRHAKGKANSWYSLFGLFIIHCGCRDDLTLPTGL